MSSTFGALMVYFIVGVIVYKVKKPSTKSGILMVMIVFCGLAALSTVSLVDDPESGGPFWIFMYFVVNAGACVASVVLRKKIREKYHLDVKTEQPQQPQQNFQQQYQQPQQQYQQPQQQVFQQQYQQPAPAEPPEEDDDKVDFKNVGIEQATCSGKGTLEDFELTIRDPSGRSFSFKCVDGDIVSARSGVKEYVSY